MAYRMISVSWFCIGSVVLWCLLCWLDTPGLRMCPFSRLIIFTKKYPQTWISMDLGPARKIYLHAEKYFLIISSVFMICWVLEPTASQGRHKSKFAYEENNCRRSLSECLWKSWCDFMSSRSSEEDWVFVEVSKNKRVGWGVAIIQKAIYAGKLYGTHLTLSFQPIVLENEIMSITAFYHWITRYLRRCFASRKGFI